MQTHWIEEHTSVLQSSSDAEELVAAATELARSDDPEALHALGTFLTQSAFLDRLDEPDSPSRVANLARVLSALNAAPSPEVARLCLQAVDEPIYLEHDRKSLILEALAAVVPMSVETAEAFRRANKEGYYAFDAHLLPRNGSPVALELFRSMMGDKGIDPDSRVELMHTGILPYRTRLATLKMVAAMLSDDLEESVIMAGIESVFDYRPEWFTLHGPMPPAWRSASNEVLHYLIALGAAVKARSDLRPGLSNAIDETTATARALMNQRGS